MDLAAVYHEAKSRYAYAVDRETIHLRLRTGRGDVSRVTLVGGDPFHWVRSAADPNAWEWDRQSGTDEAMRLEYSTALHDYWFIAIRPKWQRMRYAFLLQAEGATILYGGRGFYDLAQNPQFRHETGLYFNFPYLNHEDLFCAPAWVRDTIWYQIFPERFADSDPRNNPPDAYPWGDPTAPLESPRSFFGGDLQGIIDQLDELQELGVNGLYLTPVFTSPSNHKYDTTDYYQIDPMFGTNAMVGHLIEQAHTRGMRVMLDAVFNHCGWLHPFWQDVIQKGRASPYYECFFIHNDPVIDFEVEAGSYPRLTPEQMGRLNYSTFAFAAYMPKWNTGHPLVKEHLLGALRYWTEEYQIDAWRLDVSNEVSHDFWREVRKLVKGINPKVYLLGENWDNAYPWLMGDQFDGVMNYELTYPIWNLLAAPGQTREHYHAGQFQQAVNELLVGYPKNVLPNLYNLVDSHDTARIRTICGEDTARVKLAYVLEMTFSGAPSVYYGSEIGLEGDKPHNRRCMPWDQSQWDLELRGLVQKLIRLRRQHPAFRAVDLTWLDVDAQKNTLLFQKQEDGEELIVAINASGQDQTLPVPADFQGKMALDLLKDSSILIEEAISLPAYGFHLYGRNASS